MAAGQWTFYNNGKKVAIVDGSWSVDDHYMILATDAYTPALTHSTVADIGAAEVGDADYAPQDLTNETTPLHTDPTKVKLDADPVNFGDPVTITAKYAIVCMGTAAAKSGTDEIVEYLDLDDSGGGSVEASGGSFVADGDDAEGYGLVG